MLPSCLEVFVPAGISTDDEEYNARTLGGGRLSMRQVQEKFFIRFIHDPFPAQSELRKAFLFVTNLYMEASSEKVFAKNFGRTKEVSIWNAVLENLEFTRKCIQSINISYAVDAKVQGAL